MVPCKALITHKALKTGYTMPNVFYKHTNLPSRPLLWENTCWVSLAYHCSHFFPHRNCSLGYGTLHKTYDIKTKEGKCLVHWISKCGDSEEKVNWPSSTKRVKVIKCVHSLSNDQPTQLQSSQLGLCHFSSECTSVPTYNVTDHVAENCKWTNPLESLQNTHQLNINN